MAFITYKQADSRWGKKNYNGSSTMATAGCGPTSCAMIAYGVDGKTTPLDTMKYMQKHGYAIRNNGTAWAGIPACLKAFGVQNVQEVPNMTKCWELMAKGYVGVFLFRSGKRGGVTWTSSGHYIAVTGYKYENGKHYVYTRDSGGRNHTGWYPYETTMKGLIPKIWLGYVAPPKPLPKPTGKYSGTIPAPTLKRGSKSDGVKALQNFLNWYGNFGLKVDGIFGSGTEDATSRFQSSEGITADGIYGKNSYAKANAYKAAAATQPVVTASAPAPKPVTASTYPGAFPTIPKGKIIECTRSVNGMRKHGLLSGDYILRFKSEERRYKMCKFSIATVNNKKISYSNYPKFEDKVKAFGYNLAKVAALKTSANCSNFINGSVLAVTGKYVRDQGAKHNKKNLAKTNFFTSHKYAKGILLAGDICGTSKHTWMIIQGAFLSVGCQGAEVTKLQNFLNWAGFNCGKADGDFGMGTLAAVKAFQAKVGITQDGIVGSGTINKMKVYAK